MLLFLLLGLQTLSLVDRMAAADDVQDAFREAKLQSGRLVERVDAGSSADRAGLRPGDLILRSGNPLTIWRRGVFIELPGVSSGFTFTDWSLVLDTMAVQVGRGDIDNAWNTVERTEVEGTISTRDLQIAQTLVRPERFPVEALRPTLSPMECVMAWRLFRRAGRYPAAAFVLEKKYGASPGETYWLLKYALSLAENHQDAEAERMVKPFVDGEYAGLAADVLSLTSTHRRDWKVAATHTRRCLESGLRCRDEEHKMRLIMAVALSGSHAEFEAARRYVESLDGVDLKPLAAHMDAAEIYVLRRSSREARVAGLPRVPVSPQRTAEVARYWKDRSPEIAAAWAALPQK